MDSGETMSADADLAYWSNIAAIAGFFVTLTGAGVGIYGYCTYQSGWKRKTDALVAYLKKKKDEAPDGKKGQQTAMHLIRYVGLTEDEILQISFENEHVERSVGKDEQGRADTLYFEYKP
jgi:hypothetical protein